jgi:signal peptidase I
MFPVKITSNSMSPAIGAGDYVLVRPSANVDRGDVILFRFPFGSESEAIKRVIALEGDFVEITDSTVLVNGHQVAALAPSRVLEAPTGTQTVPAGSFFVLGDNAAVSIDSRRFGPVPKSEVEGTVRAVLPL